MASEYCWTIEYIEDLTYKRIKSLLKVIEERKSQEEYLDRLHIGMQATAIIKALGASLDKKDIKIEDLIGKSPGEDIKSTETIEEWKNEAKKRELKISS